MRQPSVPRPGNLRRDDVGAVIDVGTGRAVTVCGELDAVSAPALSAMLALLIDDDGEIYVEISAVGCEIAGYWAFYAHCSTPAGSTTNVSIRTPARSTGVGSPTTSPVRSRAGRACPTGEAGIPSCHWLLSRTAAAARAASRSTR